jgi:hypothetical protein
MQVLFTKHTSKPPTLTCIRDDGTTTWFQSKNHGDFFAIHDLTHYAIETILQYDQAFFGLVAHGRNLDDFAGTVHGEKETRAYPSEALYAEIMAGLLTVAENTNNKLNYGDFITSLKESCVKHSTPVPKITEVQIQAIRSRVHELTQRWHSTPEGDTLHLTF